MNTTSDSIVVMFADVAGSTMLYETLGDTLAHQCISKGLDRMILHAHKHQGHWVETIGDEVMLTFENVEDAIVAAVEAQQELFRQPVVESHFIKMRIGFHFGPIEYDANQHPFGDTVNVAARVVSLCDAGRIIATKCTFEELQQPSGFQIRQYQKTRVKGKAEPLLVEEVVWDYDDVTSLHEPLTQSLDTLGPANSLVLNSNGTEYRFDQQSPAMTVGRESSSTIQIDNVMASRSHATIEIRWGEVVLKDHSTNGTYVQMLDPNSNTPTETRLHRREIILTGSGTMGIGSTIEKAAPECLIEFQIEPPKT